MYEDYIKNLKKRAEGSHVHKKHQLLGLEIAETLHDRPHRSLYMKLAKNYNGDELLRLAKDVSERVAVHNRGGYFMRIIAQDEEILKILKKQKVLVPPLIEGRIGGEQKPTNSSIRKQKNP